MNIHYKQQPITNQPFTHSVMLCGANIYTSQVGGSIRVQVGKYSFDYEVREAAQERVNFLRSLTYAALVSTHG